MESVGSVREFKREMIRQALELPERNEEMELSIFQTLFRDGDYDLILEGLEQGIKLTHQIQELMELSGNLKLYQFLASEKKLTFGGRSFARAMKCGNLETIIWMVENGTKVTDMRIIDAIDRGHIHIAKWLHSRGGTFFPRMIRYWRPYYQNQELMDWVEEILGSRVV